jgi:hypothetical protein
VFAIFLIVLLTKNMVRGKQASVRVSLYVSCWHFHIPHVGVADAGFPEGVEGYSNQASCPQHEPAAQSCGATQVEAEAPPPVSELLAHKRDLPERWRTINSAHATYKSYLRFDSSPVTSRTLQSTYLKITTS